MWEADIGYLGVPNGEQVKSRLEVANRPGLRLDLASRVCMLLVVYVQFSLFDSDARARLRVRLQANNEATRPRETTRRRAEDNKRHFTTSHGNWLYQS